MQNVDGSSCRSLPASLLGIFFSFCPSLSHEAQSSCQLLYRQTYDSSANVDVFEKQSRRQALPLLSQECADSSCLPETCKQAWVQAAALPHHPRSVHGPLHLHSAYQGDSGQHMLRKETASTQTKSSPLVLDKMAEEKDLSLPPLTKTPKSELTAEQPMIKKTGIYQKR